MLGLASDTWMAAATTTHSKCVVAAAQKGLTHLSPLVMTGMLGGFTTFSSFSLETVNLIERGQIGTAATYVALSVGLSIGGLMLGLWFARGIFV